MEWRSVQTPVLRQTAWTLLLARVGIIVMALLFGATSIIGFTMLVSYPDAFEARALGPLVMAFAGVTVALAALDQALARQRIALRVAQTDPEAWGELLRRQRNVWNMVVFALLSGVWFVSWWAVALWWA